ncbi:MAG: TniQ family protein [Xenococcus sp. MO_188.B8]|nr:TniQ family protein [Xenococcus sp. MO_188.B8]
MSNQGDIYHELWNPKSLDIRQPTHLFFIEPIEIGTSNTESLSSYLTRLAQEHCVTPKKLIMREIAPLIMGNNYHTEMQSKNVSTIFGNSDAKPAINGMREMTRSLVDALENLTLRQDLKFLSCLTWKGIIKERGLFRQNKAWCPLCFEQWFIKKQPLYEPLVWSFKDVNFCLQHHCQLCDRCPHCDSALKAIANSSRLGFCSRCKSWLGSEHIKNQASLIDDLETNCQKITGIGELIAVTPMLKFPPTLSDLMRKLQIIHFCFERVVNQDLTQFIALGKIMEQLKITLTQHQDKPLNLINLLIPVCDRAKISLAQFLSQDFQTLSEILFTNLNINYTVNQIIE